MFVGKSQVEGEIWFPFLQTKNFFPSLGIEPHKSEFVPHFDISFMYYEI